MKIRHIIILAIVNILAYFPMLKGYFYFDDYEVFGKLQNDKTLISGILESYHQGYALRFTQDFFVWLRFRLFGWSSAPYFAVSIFQSILVAILVFILTQQLFKSRRISLLAGIFISVAFPPIQVVTWITGSTISLMAIFYLATIIAFLNYCSTKKTYWYIATLALFILAIFTNEYTITLLPTLFIFAVFLAKSYELKLSRILILLLPMLLLLIPYIGLQIYLFKLGTSEGVVLGGFHLGVNNILAFVNLAHLLVPNLYFPRLITFLNQYFPIGIPIISVLTPLAIIFWVALTILILIKGNNVTRLLIVWIYLAFAPFPILVNADGVQSSRYLYLPMIGFSILLAFYFTQFPQWMAQRGVKKPEVWIYSMIGIWLLYNLIPMYIFEMQEVSKGNIRRTIIEQIRVRHPDFPPGSTIYIGVPDPNFRDLKWAIEDFYPGLVSVYTVPPASWPVQNGPNHFLFQYMDGKLQENLTP